MLEVHMLIAAYISVKKYIFQQVSADVIVNGYIKTLTALCIGTNSKLDL